MGRVCAPSSRLHRRRQASVVIQRKLVAERTASPSPLKDWDQDHDGAILEVYDLFHALSLLGLTS